VSLVSEALKKAEREAAARAARGGGPPQPFEAPLQPYRAPRASRFHASRWTLVGGLLLIAGLALGWWSTARKASVKGVVRATPEALAAPAPTHPATTRETTQGATAAQQVPAPLAQAISSPGVEPAAVSGPEGTSESTLTEPARPPLPKTTQQQPPPSPSASAPRALPTPAPPAPAAPAAAAARPAAKPSGGPGEYLRRVDFADGSSLELGGIVYSEAAPFCYLNGRLVGIGEFVLGRRIDRIERDKVVLTGDDGTLVLRLKPN
jgi:hypothetical protein